MREIRDHSLAAVLCDKDGTLVNKEKVALDMWARAAGEKGFSLPDQVLIPMLGRDRDTVLGAVQEHFEAQRRQTSHDMQDRIDQLFEAPGAESQLGGAPLNAIVEEVRALKERYVLEYVQQHGLPRMAGLDSLLAYLRERSNPSASPTIGIALATADQSADAELHLSAIGARDVFPVIVGADHVAHSKPDPETYVKAASQLGLHPANCVGIEDTPAGLESLRRAGIGAAIVVPNLYLPPAVREEMARAADFSCVSLAEIPDILERLLRR